MIDEKKEANPKDEYIEEKDLADILEQITPFVESWLHRLLNIKKLEHLRLNGINT